MDYGSIEKKLIAWANKQLKEDDNPDEFDMDLFVDTSMKEFVWAMCDTDEDLEMVVDTYFKGDTDMESPIWQNYAYAATHNIIGEW